MIMKIKTKDLIGAALDWAVSKADNPTGKEGDIDWWERNAEGFLYDPLNECTYSPSTDWKHGGVIIEHEGIQLHVDELRTEWLGSCWGYPSCQYGPTPLIAAMRCFVAHKLGDEIEIPEELC